MFIVSLTYTADLAAIDALLPAHVDYLKRQYAAGNFLLSGRKIPRSGGIILSSLTDEDGLRAVLREDPFHVHGVATYELTEFSPSMAADGLSSLIEA